MATTTILTTLNILQGLANAAQVFLVFGLYLAWRQISITLSDLRIRNEREAKSRAVSEAAVFSNLISSSSEILNVIPGSLRNLTRKHFMWTANITQFRPSDLFTKQKSSVIYEECTNALKTFLDEHDDAHKRIVDLTNKIEAFSLAFTTRLADEKSVYLPLSKPYCEIVEELYIYYVWSRRSDNKHAYQNTYELYKVWKERQLCESIQEAKDVHKHSMAVLDQKLTTIEQSTPDTSPIGVNIR